ncbi:type II toxin-antitoxin system VapC family toxin [Rhizobium sp. XQZ8]|uniref:type II toxin-antitoxin system VapC family toxin n=1 Tax=Rhizobium populisoli TaxID=2859785 RepID=UPI001CA4F983|nr:type II toxin-antitoxin system VapC family toxin [Rhizobium populisoli]MBW6424321.1 type II toxin-antitoxin system VapC family toxin [Rhizobium populisoli]
MIAVDTSVIIAMSMNEPEVETFRPLIGREPVIIGWPTLFEARMVLSGKGFTSAAKMIKRLAETVAP